VWTDYLRNPKAILTLWSSAPELRDVELHSMKLWDDGPRCTLFICLNSFPDVPPKKWQAAGYNSIIIELDAFGVSDMTVQGWGTNNWVTLECSRAGGRPETKVRITGTDLVIEFNCDTLFLQHFHPYLRDN
jgi:hypothetical protein